MKTTLGNQLNPTDQKTVLSKYIYRFTADNTPAWAKQPGHPYPLQFKNDQDWLAHTYFRTTISGRLDQRVTHCESHPTWPQDKSK
jgi:hypothetical protein